MAKKNEIKISITGDTKGLRDGLGDADNAVEGFGSKFAKWGAGLATAGLAAAAAIGAVAKVAYDLGAQFDDAYDTLRIKTGSTGAALDDLKDDFRAVVSTVPTDFATASQAIAGLNSRLGLTGKPLQQLSRQMLELSRITETDLGSNVETLTRLFGDWSISADQQSATMDKLFRASQKTGVGFDQVASTVTQYGTTLRGLGFNLDESVTLLAKWGKEGVNTEAVLGAMKKAFGSFSAEYGEKAPAQFRAFIDEISKAPTAAAAAGIAIDKLGVRNGPDFAAAVGEGRFAYGDLLAQISGGSDTIRGAADDTSDFAEKWEIFRNKVMLKLEPVLTRVFDLAGQFMSWVEARGIPLMEEWGTKIRTQLQPVLDKLQRFWREHGDTVLDVLTKIGQALWVAFQVQTTIWGAIITAIGGVIDAVRWLYNTFSSAMSSIVSAGATAVAWVRTTWDGLVGFFRALPGRVSGLFGGMFDGIKNAFKSALNWVIDKWNGISFTLPTLDLGPLGKVGGWTVSTPNIPRLAQGGIVTGPTLALLGDNTSRREAVVPLERADQLGFGGGGNTYSITVNAPLANPRDVGRQVVEAIAAYERQVGAGWRRSA